MIMGKIQDTFMSTDPKMVHQAGVLSLQGQATVQGQMVLGTE